MTGDTQKVVEVYGFEAIHLQIDDVYFFRRIAEDFLGIDINSADRAVREPATPDNRR